MEAPQWMFSKALSHRQKVLRLYKRAMRGIEGFHMGNSSSDVLETRFHQVVLRNRFDTYKNETDTTKSRQLLIDGCRELWEKRFHAVPIRFPQDPYGIAVDRELNIVDSRADMLPYVEREQFPYYFNRREWRKKELVAHWEKIQEAWDEELTSIQRKPPPQ